MQHAFKLGPQIEEFLRQLLSYVDPSEVFTLLNLIIRILGQGLSERNIEKALREELERLK